MAYTDRTRISKYLVKSRLGEGSSGAVYLALDEFSRVEVAIKVYESNLLGQMPDHVRLQFLTEASLAGQLDHPHIAKILEASTGEDISYVVTEYVPGGSLADIVKKGELPPVGDGEWFGEMPCIIGKAGARGATVETSADSALVEFPRNALEALGDHCQLQFAKALMRNLSDRLAFFNVRVVRMGDETE